MKKFFITITMVMTLGQLAQAVETTQVLFERKTSTHGIGDFKVTCLESHQFSSGQSTIFLPAINIKLSQLGVDQLKLLNETSNAVEAYFKDGRTTQMSLDTCNRVKSQIASAGVTEAVQIALVPLQKERCSLQVHSKLSLNLFSYDAEVLHNLEGDSKNNNGFITFGTYDLVEVIEESCDNIKTIDSPLLDGVKAKAQDIAKVLLL